MGEFDCEKIPNRAKLEPSHPCYLKGLSGQVPAALDRQAADPLGEIIDGPSVPPEKREKAPLSPQEKTIRALKAIQSKLSPENGEVPLSDVQNMLSSRHIITIDDGPSKATLDMLDLLDQRNIKAVFYLIGDKMATAFGKKAVKEIVKRGHVIGYHTMEHEDRVYSEDETIRDFRYFRALLNNILGFDYPLIFIRARGGKPMSYENYLTARKKDIVLQKTAYLGTFTKEHHGANWDVADNQFRNMHPGKNFYKMIEGGQAQKDDYYAKEYKGTDPKVFLLHSRDEDAGTLKRMLEEN